MLFSRLARSVRFFQTDVEIIILPSYLETQIGGFSGVDQVCEQDIPRLVLLEPSQLLVALLSPSDHVIHAFIPSAVHSAPASGFGKALQQLHFLKKLRKGGVFS